MSVVEQMKTVVSLGGAVARSFQGVGSALNETVVDARGAVRDLNMDQRKLFRTLEQGKKAAQDLEGLTQQYGELGAAMEDLESRRDAQNKALKSQRRERTALARQIDAANSEGRDVSELVARHDALTAAIEQQASERDQLNKEIFETRKQQSGLDREMKRLRERSQDVAQLEGQYRDLGDEIERSERKASAWERVGAIAGRMRKRMGQVVAVGGAMVGMSSMLGGLATATNRATAEQDGLAKAYGMSIGQFKAWGGIASEVGLDPDAAGDLVEELTNKVGEFKALGEQSAVAEVFGSLGLDAAMLEGMNAAEQFEFIMKRIEGVADDQQAASLADILMGGEGNKIVTYMRQSGKSLDELLQRHERFNLLTSAGASGAGDYSRAINALFGTVSTTWQEISGIVGGELAPTIDELAESVAGYARENKGELVESLKSGISLAGDFVVGLWSVAKGVGSAVSGVAEFVGGMDNLVEIGGYLVAGVIGAKVVTGLVTFGTAVTTLVTAFGGVSAVLPLVSAGIRAVGLAVMANPIGLVVGGLIAAGTALYMNWDTVLGWFTEKIAWFKTEFPVLTRVIKTVFDWSPLGIIVNNWEPVTGFFVEMWDDVTDIFTSKIEYLGGMVDTVKGWAGKIAFWSDDDDEANEAERESDRRAVAYRSGVGRAAEASRVINDAAPGRGGNVVNQRVESVQVVAAPGQTPEEVGRAVIDQLGGHHDAALYDIPMG